MTLLAGRTYAQQCPDSSHPHAIDLGLTSGTKWACCNVGTDTPEGFGAYYAWGETEEKENYDWDSYAHYDTSEQTCHDIGTDIAATEYDAAYVRWGSSWRMPSMSQIQELVNECSYSWTKVNGVDGALFTGPNGSKIFLPAANTASWNSHDNSAGSGHNGGSLKSEKDPIPLSGCYWCSTQHLSYSSVAGYLFFSYGTAYSDVYRDRYCGLTVRPVVNETNSSICQGTSHGGTDQTVYNIGGLKVSDHKTGLHVLPSGIYIVNGKKRLIGGERSK